MIGKPNDQSSLMQLVTLEELVPQDHFLRKLDQVLDLRFVKDFLTSAYHPSQGREGIVPELAVRMILLSYLYGLSDVRVCDEVRLHAGYRWFCRLDFHDAVPERSTLVKFRVRCRAHGLWEELFHRIVTQCGDLGLLSGRHLVVDSTQVKANASIKSMQEIQDGLTEAAERVCAEKKTPRKPGKNDDHHHTDFHGKRYSNATHRSTSDPDARFYRKARGKEAKLSYKTHNLADTKSRVIVATSATGVCGDEARDGAQAIALLKQLASRHGIVPKTLCADTMYGTAETIAKLIASGINPHIPLLVGEPPPTPVWRRRTFNFSHFQKRREKVEKAKALQRAAELAATSAYQISRKLRHRIEHLFGEAKQSHGLSRARFRGLEKMNEQATLTATVQNLKRMVKFLDKPGKNVPKKGRLRPNRSFFYLFLLFGGLLPFVKALGGLFCRSTILQINQMAFQNG